MSEMNKESPKTHYTRDYNRKKIVIAPIPRHRCSLLIVQLCILNICVPNPIYNTISTSVIPLGHVKNEPMASS